MLNRLIPQVKISKRAYASMLCELEEYPKVETGGVLLGYSYNDCWNIIEATDPGIHAVRKPAEIQCDMAYLEHTVNILNRIYNPPLEQVGVWHKHNHSYNPPFSEIDKKVHVQLASAKSHNIVSILFQKENEMDEYSMHMFVCDNLGNTKEIEFEIEDLNEGILYEYS